MLPNGGYCDCENGQKRQDLDRRRKNDIAVREELRRATVQKNIQHRIETVPPRMRPFTFESYMLAIRRSFTDGDASKLEALEACRDFAAKMQLEIAGMPKHNLLLVGEVGTGKTGLSIPILRQGIQDGLRVAYMDFTVFMSECHAATIDDKEQAVMSMCKLDLLVIDDLGTAERRYGDKLKPESPDAIRVATQIINYRVQRFLPTVITSNLDIAGINEQFGQRLASRIVESSATLWVGGRDMRLDSQPQVGRPKRL